MADTTRIFCEWLITSTFKLTSGRGRAFAIDMFASKMEDALSTKEAGLRYRREVLEPGGSRPEMDILTDYLGHRPDLRPYLKWLGANVDAIDTGI